ncbi:unnamed protein product [Owenia fusiformis]|nr:unnamed protein product [Owenia fusiformis]
MPGVDLSPQMDSGTTVPVAGTPADLKPVVHLNRSGRALHSKFLSNKSDSAKEIEAWILGEYGGKRNDMARVSGQLTDNVTEERMLSSKLMELSKERYKFISQSEYEKKVFVDRQQRKTSVMKDLLRGIDVNTLFVKRKSSSNQHELMTNDKQTLQRRATIVGDRDRPPTKRQTSMPEIAVSRPRPSTSAMPKLAQSQSPPRPNTNVANFNIPTPKQSEKLPSVGHMPPAKETENKEADKLKPKTRATFPPNNNNGLRENNSVKSIAIVADISSQSRRRHSPKVGQKGPVFDNRYMKLQQALTNTYLMDCECIEDMDITKVRTVIKSMDALHVTPRRIKEMKPKMSDKVEEFMKERGLAF